MQEYELKVLEQYPIEVKSTRKTRGAFFCDTDRGLLLLREAGGFYKRVPALQKLQEYLREQDAVKVDQFLANQEGAYVSYLEEMPYVLKQWFAGKELDIRKTKELMDGMKNLARLHLLMQGQIEESMSQAEPIGEEYQRHNRELKKVRRYVREKSSKGEFELAFLKKFEDLYSWAEKALEELETSDYEKLYSESIEKGCLVHGEYNYHNILVTNEGIATTNFDKCKRNVQVEDVYYYLRKILEKHSWNVRLCDCLLNAYCAVRPMSAAEIAYLKNRFLYPEKFWKIADSYYRSNKAWMPVKNIEKLQMTIAQVEEKSNLLQAIFLL